MIQLQNPLVEFLGLHPVPAVCRLEVGLWDGAEHAEKCSYSETPEAVKETSWAKGEVELQSSCSKALSQSYRKFWSWRPLQCHPHINQSLDVAWLQWGHSSLPLRASGQHFQVVQCWRERPGQTTLISTTKINAFDLSCSSPGE